MIFFRVAVLVYSMMLMDQTDDVSDGHRDYKRKGCNDMSRKDRIKDLPIRYIRYDEGAVMYSMCQSTFEDLAKEAKATHKVGKLVLVNVERFENYLEMHREF